MPGQSFDFRPRSPMGFGGQRRMPTRPYADNEAEQFLGMPQATQNLFGTLSTLRQNNQAVANRQPAGRQPMRGEMNPAGVGVFPIGRQQTQPDLAAMFMGGGAGAGGAGFGGGVDRTDEIGRRFAGMMMPGNDTSGQKYNYDPATNKLSAANFLRQDLINRGLMTDAPEGQGRAIINRPGGAAPTPGQAGMGQMNFPAGAGGDPMMALMMQMFGGGQNAGPVPMENGLLQPADRRALVRQNAQWDTAARKSRLGTGDPLDMLLRSNPFAYAQVTQAQGNAGLGQQKVMADMFGAQQKAGAENRATSAAVLGAIPAMLAGGVITKEQAAAMADQAMQDVFGGGQGGGGAGMGGGAGGGQAARDNPQGINAKIAEFKKANDAVGLRDYLRAQGQPTQQINKTLNSVFPSMIPGRKRRHTGNPEGSMAYPLPFGDYILGEGVDDQGNVQPSYIEQLFGSLFAAPEDSFVRPTKGPNAAKPKQKLSSGPFMEPSAMATPF